MAKELLKDNQIAQVPAIIVLAQSFSQKERSRNEGMLPEKNLEAIQGIPILAENVKYHDVDSYQKLLDVMNSL